MPYTPFVAIYKQSTSSGDRRRFDDRAEFVDFHFVPGWYVALRHAGSDWPAPMCFARDRDAQMAAEAVNRMTDWYQDTETLRRQIRTIGWDKLRRTMLESLQW